MSEALLLLAFAVGAFLTVATVWSRRETWVRGAAVVAFALMLPLLAGTHFFALSWSAPLSKWTVPDGKYRVLSVSLRQDMAIWLWLDTQDGPRAYHLPWDNDMANQLQGYADLEGEDGIPYFMYFDPDDNDAEFDRVIIPPDPPKWLPNAAPVYQGGSHRGA